MPKLLTGKFLLDHNRPFVYVWRRGGNVLYIGSSTLILNRLGRHNVIGRLEALRPEDIIELHECETVAQMKRLETEFIRDRNPKYNRAGVVPKAPFKHLKWVKLAD